MPTYETKDAAAARIYPGITYDTALPQGWVNSAIAGAFPSAPAFDPVPHFVWGYPDKMLFGLPLPLTQEGMDYLIALNPSWAEYSANLANDFLIGAGVEA
jgi:hypothetical protein